jgi:site-specific DNA-methyltransferase (adenine-specific)
MNKKLLKLNPLVEKIYGGFSLLREDDAQLFASISNEGILEPLIITPSNLVISGNRRLMVANCLSNINDVPVVIIDVKDSDVDSYMIMQYNQQRVKNIIQIAKEFELIRKHYGVKQGIKDKELTKASKDAQETLMSDNKTSESTIKRVLKVKKLKTSLEKDLNQNSNWTEDDSWDWLHIQHTVRKKEVKTIFDSITEQHAEINNSSLAESQKLYQTETFNIIHGDSSDLSGILKDKQVDCIPNSPPYYGAVRTYIQDDIKVKSSTKGLKQTGHESTVDAYVENLMKTYRECKRVLKDTGSIFINVADTVENGVLQNVPFKIIEAMKLIEMSCVQSIIWFKITPTPVTINAFQPSMEYVLHFVKSNKYKWRENWFGKEDEFIGNVTFGSENRRFRNVMIYYPTNDINSNIPMNQGLFQTTSVNNHYLVKLLKTKGYELQHNALFPLEVPLICVLSTTDPGDTVLDVFGGMSTTGLIAYAHGCKYYGVDRSKVYSAQASIRIEDFLSKNPHLVKIN